MISLSNILFMVILIDMITEVLEVISCTTKDQYFVDGLQRLRPKNIYGVK